MANSSAGNPETAGQVIDPNTYQVLYGPEIPLWIGRLTFTGDQDAYLLRDVYEYDDDKGLTKWGSGTIKNIDPLVVADKDVTHWSNLDPEGFPVTAIRAWQQPREI